MPSNRLAFAALAFACIGAAAGGGYLATRQNTIPTPAAAQTPVTPPVPSRPVQETEGTVGDIASKPPATVTAPKATPAATTAKRAEPQASVARDIRATAARREQPPTLTNTWPSSAASQTPAAPPTPPATTDAVAPAPRADDRTDRVTQEPARAPEPPQKTFEELVISADSVIGLQTENRISSETARVEDRVEARVTRDVKVGDRVAIPAGARALGSVMQVERGGKFKERARLGIRFTMLVLADGTRVPISTDTIFRDGEAPGNTSAAKVGGAAVGGAILGALLGGAKGAVMGGAAGAAGGSAAVMAGDRSPATLPVGTPMTVRILAPVTITTEKN
jgi:type IV secretory pathway VirB10-like protein